jgi:hypothetical protein
VFAPADQQDNDDGPRRDEPGQSVTVVRLVAANCVRLLRAAAADRLLVVDVGRLDWASAALPLAAAADVLLVLTRPWPDGVDAVQVRRDRILSLPGMRASVRLVLAGRPPCPAQEIADAVGLPVAGQVPEDRRGAAVLAGQARPGWGWTRLELPRAARAIALSLDAERRATTGPAGRRAVAGVAPAADAAAVVGVSRP